LAEIFIIVIVISLNIINYHILLLLQYVLLSFAICYFWGRRCRARL